MSRSDIDRLHSILCNLADLAQQHDSDCLKINNMGSECGCSHYHRNVFACGLFREGSLIISRMLTKQEDGVS